MLRVGLTGGIASGKSEVARRLAERGAVLVDADVLAREAVAPGSAGLAEVAEAFGPGVLADDGGLDRAALGAIVFADPARRKALNAIVHPRVRARAAEIVAAAEAADPAAVIVQDIPLLVETGQAGSFDVVVVVDAPDEVRIARLAARSGMGEDEARARMAAQASRAERLAAAHHVIENSGTVAELRAAVDRLWEDVLVPAARARA
ncbi:dephospho-CoA kinase [Sinomonas halotolerans]|uniref:Dephospho-CoA kinase n=1 Tax=Sinomonas halotolerans TaxID=1644133 RepID=A0ABU9X467_9MICC